MNCFLSTCCCVNPYQKEKMNEAILLNDAADEWPSLLQRLCFCYCFPKARVTNGMDQIPQLRGLAGLTVQDGTHITGGSLQTLKYAKWNPEERSAYMPVFSGSCWCYGGTTGVWAENAAYGIAAWIINFARLGNYSYKFIFSEDFLSGDIDIWMNLCICCPMLPPWFKLPRCLVHFTFKQDNGSEDGTDWSRYNATCGGAPQFYYKLREVWDADGNPGKFFDRLEIVPQQLMVSY